MNNQQILDALSLMKNLIGDMETLLSQQESKKNGISDILNKLLNNNDEINQKIIAGVLKDVDLSSLEASSKLVPTLIPAAPLGHFSTCLVREIRRIISDVNVEKTANAGENDFDTVVLLISLLLVANYYQE